MSSAGKRERSLPVEGSVAAVDVVENGTVPLKTTVLAAGKQVTVSESHPRNRKTGSFDAGGPFYTSRVSYFFKDGHIKRAYRRDKNSFYSGPVRGKLPTSDEMALIGFKNPTLKYGDSNESSMKVAGTNAMSYVNPVNPVSNLGTTLAEIHREGITLPGIETWKNRAQLVKAAGSEYLNYIFGWAPLLDEVHQVGSAVRHHRDIMKQYQNGEGRNTHRRFDYPLQSTRAIKNVGTEVPVSAGFSPFFVWAGTAPVRTISLLRETKRWFEGCFTYALPSSSDNWRKALGFGSEADKLFGLTLTPEILWELTPWSWAVDWFSNAGEVVNNVTRFGLAGLVLRYGYMMEESIERITAEVGGAKFATVDKPFGPETPIFSDPSQSGIEIVTKRRVPADPFGFSIGWEGLSPTQLAITAALGITRLL
jgi:hypothetical protein